VLERWQNMSELLQVRSWGVGTRHHRPIQTLGTPKRFRDIGHLLIYSQHQCAAPASPRRDGSLPRAVSHRAHQLRVAPGF
jgi:hypothetical protein